MYTDDYDTGIRKRWYRDSEIDALPASRRHDLVGPINPRSKADMRVLDSWIRHLKLVRAPFIVKEHTTFFSGSISRKHLILWKELRI